MMFRRIVFIMVIWAIRKYFSSGMESVYGTNAKADKVIAYRWGWSVELENAVKNDGWIKKYGGE